MWPVLRLVVDMGQPLSEVEKWDLDDIRYFNSILDMRRDCEAAADAYRAMQPDIPVSLKRNTEVFPHHFL